MSYLSSDQTARQILSARRSSRRGAAARSKALLSHRQTARRAALAGAVALAAAAGTLALAGWRRSFGMGHSPVQAGLVAIAGASIAVADTLIKRAVANSSSFVAALSHPLMFLAVALYVLQIVLVAYVFVNHWNFTLVGFSQMIVYAATVVLVSTIVFQERITLAHAAGLALALGAALLMSV